MSLIDEALRRAREEAARQDAAKRDAQYRQVPSYAPPQRSGISPALIGASVALCIVAGIGIGVFLGGDGRDRKAEPEAVEASAPASPVAPSEEPSSRPISVAEEVPVTEPVPTPTPEPEPEEQPVRQEVPIAEAEPLEPPPAPDPAPTPVEVPETPTPTPEPAPAPAPEVRSYVREVPLPDGGTLRLNGIAFSATQPVALINDKVLAKGESYQGFIVADIQANMVELRGNGMTVRVSLK